MKHYSEVADGFLSGLIINSIYAGISLWIWNASISELLHLPEVTYWQAYLLLWLLRIIGWQFTRHMTSAINDTCMDLRAQSKLKGSDTEQALRRNAKV